MDVYVEELVLLEGSLELATMIDDAIRHFESHIVPIRSDRQRWLISHIVPKFEKGWNPGSRDYVSLWCKTAEKIMKPQTLWKKNPSNHKETSLGERNLEFIRKLCEIGLTNISLSQLDMYLESIGIICLHFRRDGDRSSSDYVDTDHGDEMVSQLIKLSDPVTINLLHLLIEKMEPVKAYSGYNESFDSGYENSRAHEDTYSLHARHARIVDELFRRGNPKYDIMAWVGHGS